MKRMFALIVAVCVMLSAAAYAEPVSTALVLQDEQAPKLCLTESGAAATVFDQDGNVLTEIPNDGTLALTDVHARDKAENAAVSDRLTASYEVIMDEVHHSDVDCKLHGHDMKVDINEVLASLPYEMTAYDLIMFELFDVSISAEASALMTDGSYVEVAFELADWQPMPLVVLHSEDGLGWQIIDHISGDHNCFTVKLPASGTLALLGNGREMIGIGESSEQGAITGNLPGAEEAGSNFTPSVTGKPAPTIVTFTGTDGESCVGYIRNEAAADTAVDIAIPNKNYIRVTAVAERYYVTDIQTHEHLEWAYDSILTVEDVGNLFAEHDPSIIVPDAEHATIAAQLDETLAQMGSGLTRGDLVVKDLFEISAYGDCVENLYGENSYLDITLATDLKQGETVVILHSVDSKHWHVHPIDEFTVGANGFLQLKLHDLGAIALLVEAIDVPVNAAGAVTSPN